MINVPLKHLRDAGVLIALGLRRARPTDKSEYRQLLDRYGTDPIFRSVVDAFAEGLGLVVLATTRSGMVLAPTADSVFGIRMADMRAMDASEKLLAGLALLGLAAYAYPNDVDLDDPDARTVDIKSVDTFIRAAARNLTVEAGMDDAPAGDSADPGDGDGTATLATARTAAEIYLDRPDYVPTSGGGRYKRGCTFRTIEEVLGWLESQGMARPQPSLGETAYQLTDRFRVLVGDEAANAAYQRLAAIRRTDDRKAS
jgi:hypothetical protein